MTFLEWFIPRCGEYRAVLFDMDGTLATGARQLPGAAATLDFLRERNFPHYLLTNDGNHSTLEKSQLIARAGLTVSPEDIVSCSDALTDLAKRRDWHGREFFILGDLGDPCYAEAARLIPCRDLERIDHCAGIIVGEGCYDWYWHIQSAMNFLRRHPECPLIVPNPDSYWPGLRGGQIGIGAGGIGRFIAGILREMGVEVELIYLGKPYEWIFRHTLGVLRERYGIAEPEPERIVMLGDALFSDIRGGNRMGMTTGLVLTGITGRDQALAAEGEFRPDLIFESL